MNHFDELLKGEYSMLEKSGSSLLYYFKVSNHEELMQFILENPLDSKVQELMEFIKLVEHENERDKFV